MFSAEKEKKKQNLNARSFSRKSSLNSFISLKAQDQKERNNCQISSLVRGAAGIPPREGMTDACMCVRAVARGREVESEKKKGKRRGSLPFSFRSLEEETLGE